MRNNYITAIAVYAPEEGKTELNKEFYESLQKAVQSVNPREDLVIVGDVNAQVGHKRVSKTVGTFGAGEVKLMAKHL